MRGALFELIVGHLVRSIEGGSIDIGVIVKDPERGKSREVDVRLVKEQVVKIYECKGYQSSAIVKAQEINSWLEERVPSIYAGLKGEERFHNSEISFEFWSCGVFDPATLAILKSAQARTGKYGIFWKDGNAIRAYAGKMQAQGIRKILEEHYFRHPLNSLTKTTTPKKPLSEAPAWLKKENP